MQKGQIHVLDRQSHHYKHSIGSSIKGDPAFIYRPYGAQFYQENLLVGNSHGSRMFKMFTLSGAYVKDYIATEAMMEGGFAMHLNNLFVKDSTVYTVKMTTDNGRKVRRARLENDDAHILPEIVEVSELNVAVDSVTSRTIITRMYVLQSNVLDTTFFAIPSNKYLVNRYSTITGQLLESTSLLGIPELRESYEFNTVLNNLFSSAAIDERDHIYIPFQEIIDVQAFKAGNFNDNTVKSYFSAINMEDKTYTLYQLEKNRAVAPRCLNGTALLNSVEMRYAIFTLLFVWLLFSFASCASRRSRYVEHLENVQTISHTEKRTIDSQSHRLTIDRHFDSLGYQETTTIIPLGRFAYHPDSGYRGRASLVQLRRRGTHTERQVLHERTQHLYHTAEEVSDSAATTQTHAIEQRDRRHTPWRWMAAVLVLLFVTGYIARRLFR